MALFSTTVPTPSGVSTSRLICGMRRFISSYEDCSYCRQHMSLPHKPEIFVGLSDRFCSFAILIETGWKSCKNALQQTTLPQEPSPPSILASSRTPICLSSMRVRN